MCRKVTDLLFCLSLFALFIQCNTHSEQIKSLQQAEGLMNDRPDSALLILEALEHPELLPKAHFAYWCLLLTQAHDKNYFTHTSDSLIKIAVDHFEQTKDIKRKTLAYYYQATVFQDLGDALRAQEYYLKALDAGKNTGDHALLGRIYSNIGTLYLFQNMDDMARDFQLNALPHFEEEKDSLSLGLVLRNLGRIYTSKNQMDSAIYYYESALPLARENSRSTIYGDLGGLYGRCKDYPKAFMYIFNAIDCLGEYDEHYPIYLTLADLYYETHQPDSAIVYLSESIKSPNLATQVGSYSVLAKIEEDRGNWPLYGKYQQERIRLRDSLTNAYQIENLQHMQSLFNYQQVEKEKMFYLQEAQQKNVYMYQLLILIGCLIVLLVVMYFIYTNKKQKEQKQAEQQQRFLIQQHQQTEAFLLEKETMVNKLERLLASGKEEFIYTQKALIVAQRQILEAEMKKNKALELGQHSRDNKFFKSDFYQQFTTSPNRISDEAWLELMAWLDLVYADFTRRLKGLCPTMSEKELRICCLVKVDIHVRRIAEIVCMTSQGVSNVRSRLYTRLTGQKGSAVDFDNFIANF
ncbi:tetratricopeptide repeat protein [Parabacteroides sp. PF5-9]|uniref:tetratricopeptide repeat protein n=1 Tax=Parabacteroides sp. PF5-9 TaxID=1742404 RepID=UPI002476ED2D|nr:tetratricopeptide repeat protein [Parabacteroides sp. PF5-9]MDH6358998.1 tetratricopeptide (TPR) repeat protein [Parabacteroides sp. PF5-9]